MHYQGFPRLLQKMDEVATSLNEEVVMQVGHTGFQSKNARSFVFTNDATEMEELVRRSRLVVCHGGVASIMLALRMGKPVIAVPRLRRYHEHHDDHQIEVVQALARQGRIVAIYDIEDLPATVDAQLKLNPTMDATSLTHICPSPLLVENLSAYLHSLANG